MVLCLYRLYGKQNINVVSQCKYLLVLILNEYLAYALMAKMVSISALKKTSVCMTYYFYMKLYDALVQPLIDYGDVESEQHIMIVLSID